MCVCVCVLCMYCKASFMSDFLENWAWGGYRHWLVCCTGGMIWYDHIYKQNKTLYTIWLVYLFNSLIWRCDYMTQFLSPSNGLAIRIINKWAVHVSEVTARASSKEVRGFPAGR